MHSDSEATSPSHRDRQLSFSHIVGTTAPTHVLIGKAPFCTYINPDADPDEVELKNYAISEGQQNTDPVNSSTTEPQQVFLQTDNSTGETSDEESLETNRLLGGPSNQKRTHMKRKNGTISKRGSSPRLVIDTSPSASNGHANDSMNSHVEMRRKEGSVESPSSATHTNRLMARSDFTLDNEPPTTPQTPGLKNTTYFDLPERDRRNFLLLIGLYFLQGIPMGLAMGSVPFLLKPHLSYSQIGVFTLASYPYSLKLLWSPIVDAVWSPRFEIGRAHV